MKSIAACRMSYTLGLTALCSCLCARTLLAQVPLTAVEAEISAGTNQPEVFQTQAQAAPGPTEDSANENDFLHRYKPQNNLFEVGVFIGPAFISDSNSFRGATVVNPGAPPTVKPFSTYKQPAPEIGIRGGYFPLSFLGGELEGLVIAAESDEGDSGTVFAARAQVVVQSPFWSVVPFLVGGVGYWNVRNDASGNDSDPAFHYGGGVKVNVTENLAVRMDIRDSITNQRANGDFPHNIEALAGANLVFGREPLGPKDGDRDGVFDDTDQCPLETGLAPSGCPIRDSDSDGIMDPDDKCVMEVGVAPLGCPVLDGDMDGVMDADDQCMSEKGLAPTGCPDGDLDGFLDRVDKCPAVPGVAPEGCLADADADGFVGADDRCPEQAETKNGFEDTDGCPDELPAAVKNFMGVIAGIEFDNNQATIRRASETSLGKAVEILKEYPSLRVEIIGHTDSRGSRDRNVELSLQRANSVREHLVARGIEANRIVSKGEGPDVPITTNDTPAGRQKNRRIEFRVIE